MRHGWFVIDGIQTGEHKLKEAIFGLAKVREVANQATVLDLGCAEGLIGKWLVDAGRARLVHGLDKHQPFIDTAYFLLRPYEQMKFHLVDLDFFDAWRELNPGVLLPQYDIVLALRIIQKLAQPRAFLKTIAAMCGNVLALNLPEEILCDERSGNDKIDPVEFLKPDFVLIDHKSAPFGHRKIFQRVQPNEASRGVLAA